MIAIRYVTCILCMFVSFTTYLTRSNISMALVSMTVQKVDNQTHPNLCPELLTDEPQDNVSDSGTEKAFDWSPQLQGSVLSCFFWSYPFFQVPYGYLADRFGGRYPIVVAFFFTAIITALGPTLAYLSSYLFIASRVVVGTFQAAIFPSMFVIIMNWMPVHERSIGMAFDDVGIHIGNIVIFFTSGFLIKRYTWTSMFYFPAIAAFIAFIATAILLRNKPEEHFLITEKEIAYIKRESNESNQGSELEMRSPTDSEKVRQRSRSSSSSSMDPSIKKRFAIPWRKMMTNKVVITLLFFKFARRLIATTVTANMPGYFKNVLNESIVSVGIIYAIGTGITFVSILSSAKMSEMVITKGWLTRTNCRKVFGVLSGLIPSIAFMMIPLMRCHSGAVKVLFFLFSVGQGCQIGAEVMIPADITANFKAILFAMANISSVIAALIAPLITGAVLGRVGLEWQAWDIIIHSFGSIGILASILFVLFISSQKQDFDDISDHSSMSVTKRNARSSSIISAMSYDFRTAL